LHHSTNRPTVAREHPARRASSAHAGCTVHDASGRSVSARSRTIPHSLRYRAWVSERRPAVLGQASNARSASALPYGRLVPSGYCTSVATTRC
jgi:hypothetical protein